MIVQVTTPQIIGDEDSENNRPILFQLKTIEKVTGYNETWINSTITCSGTSLEMGGVGNDRIIDESGGKADTWGSAWPWATIAAGEMCPIYTLALQQTNVACGLEGACSYILVRAQFMHIYRLRSRIWLQS